MFGSAALQNKPNFEGLYPSASWCSQQWTAVFHEWMSSFFPLLLMRRIRRNNLSTNLYQLLSRHSLSLQKKKSNTGQTQLKSPCLKCFARHRNWLGSVEHEPSTNTHPAVISTLSHFAFVKFCILGLYESGALPWQGNDVQNSNLFLRLCAGRGVDLHWSRTVWKWRTELWIM